jgi:hypothetical protein
MNRIRRLFSPSMIVALIALFVALGGAAYATQNQQHQTVLGAKIVTRIAVSNAVRQGGSGIAAAACPTGYAAISGGSLHLHDYSYPDGGWHTIESRPAIWGSRSNPSGFAWGESGPGGTNVPKQLPAPTGWVALMSNAGPAPEARFMVAAVCAKVVVDR